MEGTILHDLDNPESCPMGFTYLATALDYVSRNKVTGYLIVPGGQIINVRKGKRKSLDGKRWLPIGQLE